MLKGERSTFGTSAETRGTVSLAMVKKEECSDLSLLSGVRKHTEVMKNSPKQEESDLVSLPWGRLSGTREKGKEKRRKLERKMNEQKLRVAWLLGVWGSFLVLFWVFFFPFPICSGFCGDIRIKKREIGSKRLSRFACSSKYCWHLSLGGLRATRFLAIVKGGFSLKSG